MPRWVAAVALLLAASPLCAAPLVKRLAITIDNGAFRTGPCPHQIDFSAEIVSRHPGQVTIQWLRSDGATTPAEAVHFAHGNETRTVFDHWTINSPYKGWEQIRVTDGEGNTALSRRAKFTNRCR